MSIDIYSKHNFDFKISMNKKKHVNHLSTHANHIHKDYNKFNNNKHRL